MYPDTQQTIENPELDPHKKYPPFQSHNFKTLSKKKQPTKIQKWRLKILGSSDRITPTFPSTALAEVAKDFRTLPWCLHMDNEVGFKEIC